MNLSERYTPAHISISVISKVITAPYNRSKGLSPKERRACKQKLVDAWLGVHDSSYETNQHKKPQKSRSGSRSDSSSPQPRITP